MPRIFPFSNLWQRRPFNETPSRIDRQVADRMNRLMVGLNLSTDFQNIHGSLVVTSGRGKFLRLRYAFEQREPIPQIVADQLNQLAAQPEQHGYRLPQITSDLAESQAACVQQLKTQAGKFVDRILAVSVTDPGIWFSEFDGRVVHQSLCNPPRLAELSGISVIDSFPDRDLVVGGSGASLDAIPAWLLFGDRNARVANYTRLLIKIDKSTEIFLLPPSDGIDDQLPNLQYDQSVGLELLDRLSKCKVTGSESLASLCTNGEIEPSLLNEWVSRIAPCPKDIDRIVSVADDFRASQAIQDIDIFRTALELIVVRIKQRVRLLRGDVPIAPIDRIWIVAPPILEALLIQLIDQQFAACSTQSIRLANRRIENLGALFAAIHGLQHIDQMPANIPWLTGASAQRILGRLTPGRAGNYRQLLINMADYCPPAMKLRDAI